jgi:S-adenosylmethionine:tRNA ribosyltransferase-isomerase
MTPDPIFVSDFDFELPDELVAQEPPPSRGESRLMVLDRDGRPPVHAQFSDLVGFLRDGDLLVVNDSRVFPARLLGHRVPSGGAVECLLLRSLPGGEWDALVHPGQKLKPGAVIVFERNGLRLNAEVVARHYHGRRTIRLWTDGDVMRAIERIGHVPLPPYIKRADRELDRDRYQTVYAREPGSVAAPTAGLHFTEELLGELDSRGVMRVGITLHVGYGTFQPVRAERVEEHRVDSEWFTVSADAAAAITLAMRERRRVIAVGTTTTRALESLATDESGSVLGASGETNLFVYPGHRFRIVSGLVTNLHLPRSSLLMLVAAFTGRERLLDAYREAIEHRYRFYSYGDAMLII